METEEATFTEALVRSLSMILVSEIGDETFIIAAILAMRNKKRVVFGGAIAALTLMTIISAALGYIVPNLISKETTHNASTILYTFFGLRLLYIGYNSKKNVMHEEIAEVNQKLDKSTEQPWMMKSPLFKRLRSVVSPFFLEAFILTFLAEWGDRSQIATVALATHKNPLGVIIGGVLGHSVCTGGAVVGGQLLAAKISQRTVAFVGGAVFICFAIHNVIFGADHDE
jgi:putative Ca2+/H+ antiporter (TMEM165/GDT1 family)